jgi:hypothetical protein
MDANPEATERDRLRKICRVGPCEICGRMKETDAQRQVRALSQQVGKLLADLARLQASSTTGKAPSTETPC